MGRLQLSEVTLSPLYSLGVEFHQRHAVEGLGVLGIETQQLLPRLPGAHCVAALLPILALIQQCLFCSGLRPSYGCHQCGNQPHGD